MAKHVLDILADIPQIVLASASPRRRELLDLAGISYEVIPSDADEIHAEHDFDPARLTMANAQAKAMRVRNQMPDADHRLVLGCDTVVVLDNDILGKPADREDARRMLTELSGHTHQVVSGVCIINAQGAPKSFVQTTDVTFYELSPELIESYLDTGEHIDKAGAYGIQSLGSVFVEGINGDYFNVVGLPLARVVRELIELS